MCVEGWILLWWSMWPFGKRNETAVLPVGVPSGIPTVRFDQGRVTVVIEAEIKSTLQDIPEIGAANLAPAYDAVLRSVRRGRDLETLCDALIRLGLTKGRASEVATLVNSRATSLMDRER